MKHLSLRIASLGALCAAVAVLAPRSARADERITYLVETLEESLNYRVRVQTIESLAQIAVTASGNDLTAILDAVTSALEDSNALVRYSAASTLVGLARSSLRSTDLPKVIAALEALADDDDADVRELVSTSLPSIRSRGDQLAGASAGGSTAPAVTRFYVAVAPLGDSSGSGRADLPGLALRMLVESLAGVSGIEPHDQVPESAAFRRELQRRNLLGFVVQGSIVELRRDAAAVNAVLSLLVLDQDQNLRVMLRGNGNAVRRTGTLTDEELPAVQVDALRAAVSAAVASLAGYLEGV